MCPQMDFLNHCTCPSYLELSIDVLCSLPCRPSLTERGDCASDSPPLLTTEHHFLPVVPPHLHDSTEFPTPPPTPPERHEPECLPTPPASPSLSPPLPSPPPAPASPPAPSAYQSDDHCPASVPQNPNLRYEHEPDLLPEHLLFLKPVVQMCVSFLMCLFFAYRRYSRFAQ